MKALLKLLRYLLTAGFGLFLFGLLTAAGVYYYLAPELPSIEVLKDVQLRVPLRVYTGDGKLIAEYGEMKRSPLHYVQIPDEMIKAVLAAEDDRFFEHPGVDYQGLLRAAYFLVRTGEKGQGGSTITMQVARNFFLSREKTYLRKISEIFLALKIEQELTKEEILELYLNKIYLGNRAYGVAAAAQVYYGKRIADLTLPQYAMIAGLPKAPSRFNPIVNSHRAVERRNYVLRRMHELGFIDQAMYQASLHAPVTASLHAHPVELEAPYVAEMVRSEMVHRYGNEAYSAGYKVYTTIDGRLQVAANAALRHALLDYDRRHGYRGPLAHVDLPADAGTDEWRENLGDRPNVGNLEPALVTKVNEQSVEAYREGGEAVEVGWDGLSWARPYIDETHRGRAPQKASDVLHVGDVVYLEQRDGKWLLAEVPQVGGALVSLNPNDGAVRALVGGFDFYQSKFNRVTQARRQPGSNFKPFIYSAALDHGFTTASIINDAPVVFEDDNLESSWRPENYSGRFFGPTRLREALVHSRNLVSIRLLRAIGIRTAIKHITRFGFDPDRLPRDLSLALGSASVTPLELVRGYAVLANGGYKVDPYFIRRIEDSDGKVLMQANPPQVCEACEQKEEAPQAAPANKEADQPSDTSAAVATPAAMNAPTETLDATAPPEPEVKPAPRVMEADNVYLVTSMMKDVIRRGTGRRARVLGRKDLAGKTGTTNEQRDAWFSGFNRDVVTTAWVGFDTPKSLGRYETGARAALPMWVEFMRAALEGTPEHSMEQPPGLVMARIDPETGQFTSADNPKAMFEIFRATNVPNKVPSQVYAAEGKAKDAGDGGNLTEQLF